MSVVTFARRLGLNFLPPGPKAALLKATAPIRRWEQRRTADTFLISFPKCGRTWLRLMIAQAIQLHHGVRADDPLEIHRLADAAPGAPRILVWHEDNPHTKAAVAIESDKRRYRDKRIIFLVRDPRDVLVSLYFHMSRRAGHDLGTLSDYLRRDVGSTASLIRYYNIWADQHRVAGDFLCVRYEDLRADPKARLSRVLEFLGSPVSDAALREAVESTEFSKMRKMEAEGAVTSDRLAPADPRDTESFKTRKGKVGGFTEYLDEADIAYLNDWIDRKLSPLYGYRSSGLQPMSFPETVGRPASRAPERAVG